MLSLPAALPVAPEVPVPPTVLLVPEVTLLRGTTSISVTRLFGTVLVEEGAVCWVSELAVLVLPVVVDVLFMLLDVLGSCTVPASVRTGAVEAVDVLEGRVLATSPVGVALVLAVSLLSILVELQAASPSANKPANSTPDSLRFMINSFL
jgi:hypothetical protein